MSAARQTERITETALDAVKAASDIVDIVRLHVNLRRSGFQWAGLCPFHKEDTPSLKVTPAGAGGHGNFYHCFGCGAGGGPIDFLMAINSWSFVEAVRFLAERYGIVLDGHKVSAADMQVALDLQAEADCYWTTRRQAWAATLVNSLTCLRQAQGYLSEHGFRAERSRLAAEMIATLPPAIAELRRRIQAVEDARPGMLVDAYRAERRMRTEIGFETRRIMRGLGTKSV